MRSRSPHLRAFAAIIAACAILAGTNTACTGKGSQNPGAQSVERQSDAEYDLARDLFGEGNPRAALDHAKKAITLNEDNEKAQYFVAVIHLSFCSTDRGLDSPDCKLAEVEKYARAAIKAKPDFTAPKDLLGQLLVMEKRCKEALLFPPHRCAEDFP